MTRSEKLDLQLKLEKELDSLETDKAFFIDQFVCGNEKMEISICTMTDLTCKVSLDSKKMYKELHPAILSMINNRISEINAEIENIKNKFWEE